MQLAAGARILELNTWVWLNGLGVDLARVPSSEWDRIRDLGYQAVWLMGVWERSPAAIAESLQPEHRASYAAVLPDWNPDDVTGSPYAIHSYEVDAGLGGRPGLAAARDQLARRRIALLLDFVPNHVAPDHPLTATRPEMFIAGNDSGPYAAGRDPYSAPWRDTIQLNAFSRATRDWAAATLEEIASLCDGVRCDMAMLVLNEVFAATWAERAGPQPEREYWTDVIGAVRSRHPEFFFGAEAYWDKEWTLQQLGFDAVYDKRLYDRLAGLDAPGIRAHLGASIEFQQKLIRFIENHDEPRAAAKFETGAARAAVIAICTLPGYPLIFAGQQEGLRRFQPVRLGRAAREPQDAALAAFYAQLLRETSLEPFRSGQWQLHPVTGWPDDQTCESMLCWSWTAGAQQALIVINYAAHPSQGLVHCAVPEQPLRLTDSFSGLTLSRDGGEILRDGLYVSLEPWQFHFFRVERSLRRYEFLACL